MTEKVQYELSLRDMLTGKLREADSAAQKLEGTINNVGKAILAYFTADAIMNFGRKMLLAGTTVENARTGLTTLLKDSNAAGKVIKDTMQDAMTTPFAFEGLLSANKALISTGMDAGSARQDVLNLANAIAATGGGDDELQRMVVNMQQIRNTGKATALDIKQFAYAGVNVYQLLADATGKPIEKIKDMEVSYDMLSMALKKAHDKGGLYANGLENMAQNTSVKISNMGNSMFQFMVKIFDTLKPVIDPIIDGINSAISWVSERFDSVSGQIASAAQSIRQGFSDLVEFLTPLFDPIQRALSSVWTAVKRLWTSLEPIKPLFNAIFSAARDTLGWIIDAFGEVFDAVSSVVSSLIDFADSIGVFDLLKGVFEGIWTVVSWIADKLKWVYDHTIKPIIEGIRWAVDQLNSLTGMNNMITNFQKDAFNQMGVKVPFMSMVSGGGIGTGFGVSNAPANIGSTTKAPGATSIHDKPQTKGAQGNKAVTITINIGSLIKDFKISTTNLRESAAAIREHITAALISATNDSQIIAGT